MLAMMTTMMTIDMLYTCRDKFTMIHRVKQSNLAAAFMLERIIIFAELRCLRHGSKSQPR
jgi:hypothetical protein